MRLPNAGKPATAAAVNPPLDDITFSVRELPRRHQRLMAGIRQTVVAFAKRRGLSGPLAADLDFLAQGGQLS
jgi:hypothetical protein